MTKLWSVHWPEPAQERVHGNVTVTLQLFHVFPVLELLRLLLRRSSVYQSIQTFAGIWQNWAQEVSRRRPWGTLTMCSEANILEITCQPRWMLCWSLSQTSQTLWPLTKKDTMVVTALCAAQLARLWTFVNNLSTMAILRRLLLNSRLNRCLWMSLNVIWDICCLWQFLCNSFQYFSQFFDMPTKVRLGADMNPLCGKHPVVAVVPSRMIWTEDRQVMHQINAAQKITGNLHHHNNYIILYIHIYIYNI